MSWREITLGSAIHVKHGFAFKGEFFAPDGKLMVVTPGNFLEKGGFRVRPSKERYYMGEFPESYLLKKDDLIVAMTEQGEGLLGSAARIPEDDCYLHNQRLGLVTVTDDRLINKQFLYWIFNSPSCRHQLRGSATGTKVKHTAPERIYKVTVSIPPVETQAEIASILDKYDYLLETNRRRITLLEESALLLYREWFVKLRFPGHESAKCQDGLPKGWKKCYLKDIATLNYGKALKESDRVAGDVPVYGSSGIVGTHDKPLIDGPVIIVGRKGNVGSVFFSVVPCFAIDTVYFISGSEVNYYLFQLLQTMNFISSDSAVPGLNRNYAYGLEVLYPDTLTLIRFEETVAPVFQQISLLKRQNIVLQNARDELLPKLMSGTIQI